MRHLAILFVRLIFLLVALYAVSNALKEFLLQEESHLDTALLILFNVLIAAICWSVGCWTPRRRGVASPGTGEPTAASDQSQR